MGLPLPRCYGHGVLGGGTRGEPEAGPTCMTLHDPHSSTCSSPAGPAPLCTQQSPELRDGAGLWPLGSPEPVFCRDPHLAPSLEGPWSRRCGPQAATPTSLHRDRIQPHTVRPPTSSRIPGELRNSDPHGPRPRGDAQLEDPWQQRLAPGPAGLQAPRAETQPVVETQPSGNGHFL